MVDLSCRRKIVKFQLFSNKNLKKQIELLLFVALLKASSSIITLLIIANPEKFLSVCLSVCDSLLVWANESRQARVGPTIRQPSTCIGEQASFIVSSLFLSIQQRLKVGLFHGGEQAKIEKKNFFFIPFFFTHNQEKHVSRCVVKKFFQNFRSFRWHPYLKVGSKKFFFPTIDILASN